MNFLRFDELTVNFDQVAAIRLRRNKNDGSFHNKDVYPYVAEIFTAGNRTPFIVHLTGKTADELRRMIGYEELDGGKKW
jgi:hypothetical protein